MHEHPTLIAWNGAAASVQPDLAAEQLQPTHTQRSASTGQLQHQCQRRVTYHTVLCVLLFRYDSSGIHILLTPIVSLIDAIVARFYA